MGDRLDSFGASPYGKLSERDQNVVGQGNDVAVRINECCLASSSTSTTGISNGSSESTAPCKWKVLLRQSFTI